MWRMRLKDYKGKSKGGQMVSVGVGKSMGYSIFDMMIQASVVESFIYGMVEDLENKIKNLGFELPDANST